MQKILIGFLTLFSFVGWAYAEDEEFLFGPLEQSFFEGFNPMLIGGRPVNPGEYPEVVYISMSGSRCSATIVGPRAVLTAGHCARGGASMSFSYEQNRYTGKCWSSPLYPRTDHDVSLCLLDRAVPADTKYASIGKGTEKGDVVTHIGYGCTRPGGGGGNDGVLRVGEAKVVGYSGYDFVTRGSSALCFGDSGGPVFYRLSNPKEEHHWVIGVNSKGNIRDTSYLARTDTQASKDFFESFASSRGIEICGVNKDCVGGQNPDPEPEPEPRPDCSQELSNLDRTVSDLKACLAK